MQGSMIELPDWFYIIFLFAIGGIVGSFLNVVIYRVPRDKSLYKPPSSCPSCDRHIRFYDNIPIFSWLLLRGRCRYCGAKISPRYFVIELLTALLFIGMYLLYFRWGIRSGMPSFLSGGWFIYLSTVILLSALIACSAIDLELWIIPLAICWFATAAGLITSAIAPLVIHPATIRHWFLMPTTACFVFVEQSTIASLAVGAAIGLGISMLLLAAGIVKRSYDFSGIGKSEENSQKQSEDEFNDRIEMIKEVIFLLPIVAMALFFNWIMGRFENLNQWWMNFSQMPVIAGLLGSLAGYFVGCAIVWLTRIFGTLAFGREAMGLGDVHLMGAAGAVIGGPFVIIAFFIAPFFGLVWAGVQMFFKKIRQIPYGPFLSLGILTVMIFQDRIIGYLKIVFEK